MFHCRHRRTESRPRITRTENFVKFGHAVFSERELAICYRPSVCRLFVTLVRSTQAVKIFGNISTVFGTLSLKGPSVDTTENFTEIVPREPLRQGS